MDECEGPYIGANEEEGPCGQEYVLSVGFVGFVYYEGLSGNPIDGVVN